MSEVDPFRTLRRYQLDGFSGADDRPPTLHELVSLDFRCGSKPEVQCGPRNVRFWGYSGSRFWASGGPLIAMCGRLPVGKGFFDGDAELVGAAMCPAC